jgi:hypothetical protein
VDLLSSLGPHASLAMLRRLMQDVKKKNHTTTTPSFEGVRGDLEETRKLKMLSPGINMKMMDEDLN